jgi:tetratricopeptide (TPR) repeat protein
MEAGQWSRAEELLAQAVQASPEDADAHRHLAEVLWQRGAADGARLQMAEALRCDPSDAALPARAGEMALAVGAHQEALILGEQAIRLNPQLAAGWALRGRTFSRLNQPDRALADLQHAVELHSQSANVLLDLAILYRQQGQPARALVSLHSLLDSYSPGEEPQVALILEGQILMALNRPHQAADCLLAATRRGPPNAEICFLLAQAQSNAGHYVAATAAAEQALAIDASHAASQQLLAQLARAMSSSDPGHR